MNMNEAFAENCGKSEKEPEVKKVRWNMLRAFSIVSKNLENSCGKIPEKKSVKLSLKRISELYEITEFQAVILVAITNFYFSVGAEMMDFNIAGNFFDLSALEVAEWIKDFKVLKEKGYIEFYKIRNCFKVTAEVIFSLHENCIPSGRLVKKEFTAFDFVNSLKKTFDDHEYGHIESFEMDQIVNELEEEHLDLEFVVSSRRILLDMYDRHLYYYICLQFMQGYSMGLQRILNSYYGDGLYTDDGQRFMNETHILIMRNLVKFSKKGDFSDATIDLGSAGRDHFLGDKKSLFNKGVDRKCLKMPDSIKEKDLFYSNENKVQIEKLVASLEESRFSEIQSRLKDEGLPQGVCVLLYGAPGTGKTETVYQLAKKTNRAVYQVDISKMKSAWYGESQKNVRELFDNYRDMCEVARLSENDNIPILLFNEADAIFAKRREVGSLNGSVDQTENAIQNIILEEMENLGGILIATTNLANNFDSAFERRFLFKVKFEKPTAEAKAKIWQSKLSWLSSEDARVLSERYELSGGEIDNIVRKVIMDEIVSGNRASLPEIEDFCGVEKINGKSKNRVLGFVA